MNAESTEAHPPSVLTGLKIHRRNLPASATQSDDETGESWPCFGFLIRCQRCHQGKRSHAR